MAMYRSSINTSRINRGMASREQDKRVNIKKPNVKKSLLVKNKELEAKVALLSKHVNVLNTVISALKNDKGTLESEVSELNKLVQDLRNSPNGEMLVSALMNVANEVIDQDDKKRALFDRIIQDNVELRDK